MSWSFLFGLRERARGSLWLVPLLAAMLGAILGLVLSDLEPRPRVFSWQYSPGTATSVLAAIIGASAALTGFVITVAVLAVQMAAGTFSARYMRIWYRDGLLKATLGALLGTLTLSFSLLRRIEADFVPDVGVTASGVLIAVSIILFLLFFDRALHRLRPAAVAAIVAEAGSRALAESRRFSGRTRTGGAPPAGAPSVLVRSTRAGALQAIDLDGLERWTARRGATVVLVHAVGDFVSVGSGLARVYGDVGDGRAVALELEGMIALGEERTIQQDPAFALRIMVDIAIRALSPAVNDPTTAVQVLNHLGGLLRAVGTAGDPPGGRDGAAAPAAVLVPTRTFEDFLALGVTEIREFGATSVQVVRRLRSLLEELHESVAPENREAVARELARLDATVEASWQGSTDRDLASRPDSQGIGGPTRPAESAA